MSLVLGFLFGNQVRFNDVLDQQGYNMLVVVLPVYLGTALNSRAYTIDVLTNSRLGIYRAALGLMFTIGVVLGMAFYLKAGADFSRLAFSVGIGTSALFIVAGRTVLGKLIPRWLGQSPLSEIIICDGVDIDGPEDAFILHAEQAGIKPSVNDPWMLDRLGHFLRNVDRVVVACPPERRRAWAMALKGADVSAEILAPELDDIGSLGTGRFVRQSTLVVAVGPLGLRDRALKRLLDLSILAVLAPVVVPVMAVVGIAVKLDSSGPVFFKQKRIGRGNRMFSMYKFRSMRTETLDGEGRRSTGRDDDRITRVGRFIRRTSLDELPQLLNVLVGDMSVAGPRPHALASTADDALFWEIDTRYWDRHAVKPGMTGLAQIRGFRGATLCREDLSNRLQADLEYLSGWTIWRDISIILSTFRVIVHRNAF
ncbi:sugar transferase [Flavisphingomonas formosensis]|uniref:sugar transferase n=1 Tax=Flavisphingomonas formosensis TaxID=861534 RepID=UPI0012FC62F8|nr:sugar transferase [Sphingomonas formosensis]